MIKLLVGPAGIGKTKVLIELANDEIRKTRGHLIYIDYRNTRMLQVDYKVRFINTGDYEISGKDDFYGFICGIIASNHDIETIYIDGLYRITSSDLDNLEDFFKKLDHIELKYNINFVITISSEEETLPKFLQRYTTIHK